jgi:hypothetical protein
MVYPTIAEDPDTPFQGLFISNTAHADVGVYRPLIRVNLYRPKVESGRRHGNFLASNSEKDGRDGRSTREGMEARTNSLLRIFGARDLGVECFHCIF